MGFCYLKYALQHVLGLPCHVFCGNLDREVTSYVMDVCLVGWALTTPDGRQPESTGCSGQAMSRLSMMNDKVPLPPSQSRRDKSAKQGLA